MKRLANLIGRKTESRKPLSVGIPPKTEAVLNSPSFPPLAVNDLDTFMTINPNQSVVADGRDDGSSQPNTRSRLDEGSVSTQLAFESNVIHAGRDIIIAAAANNPRRRESRTDMRQVADWLTSLNFHAVHKDIYEKVTPGTGSWIFEHPAYLKWISKESGTLWGTGMPGAGKTCLASIAVKHLMALPSSTVIYVYCQYKEELTTPQILASLLKQLIEASNEAASYVESNLYITCMRTNTKPVQSELLRTLQNVLSLFPRVFVVIDALDELDERVRQELVGALTPLLLSLFMTSRPLVLLHMATPGFEIRAPSHDFKTFIESQLDTLPKLRMFLDVETSAAMIKRIEHKSEGMFLLAALQLAALSTKGVTNSLSLESTVDQLPVTLDEMYELTLHRIQRQSPEEQALARRALLCVMFAARFLKVDELLEVLATDLESVTLDGRRRTNEKVLLSVCLGLLTIEKESGTFHLIHYTAQTYLEVQNILPFVEPHTYMSNISAIYLSLSHPNLESIASHDDLEEVESSHPFFSYSIRNLGHHTRLASPSPNDTLPEHVGRLFDHDSTFLLLPTVNNGEHLDHGTVIHFAAFYGLTSVFKEKIQHYTPISGVQSSPLFYACLGGAIPIVQNLLSMHQFGTIHASAVFGASALHPAAENGYTTIVSLLLDAGEAAKAIEASDYHIYSPDSLVNSAIDINASLPDTGETALFLACQHGHEQVVQLLVSCKQINVNASQANGWTPLHITASVGHVTVIRALLSASGINVNAETRDGATPVIIASQNGHTPIVQLLLGIPGINVNAKADSGTTALYIASQNGRIAIVRLLLRTPGIDINTKKAGGRTALHIACWKGHKEVVQLLLGTPGIDTNVKDDNGATALILASQKGHEPVVRLLLSTPGIDVNAKQDEGITAFYLASQNGHASVVQLLLARPGIDVNDKWEEGGATPLIAASHNGHASVVQILLNVPGIDINARHDDGWTALHIASQNGYEPVVRLLLGASGIDVNATDREGWTALYMASSYGHEAVVRTLLSHPGIDEHARTEQPVNGCLSGETALQVARRRGHANVVVVFEERDLDDADWEWTL